MAFFRHCTLSVAGNTFLAKSRKMISKGSILPSILGVEEELIAREKEDMNRAKEIIQKAELEAERLVEDAATEIHIIENREREKLLNAVDARVEELREREERKLADLEKSIRSRRVKALDYILNSVLPHREEGFPG